MSSEALEATLDRLKAIAARDLEDRSLTPGEAADLLAALAVAREREQRATDGCEKAAETFAELAEALTLLRHPTLAAACRIAEAGTRAALVDEPAAGPQTVLGDDRDAVVSRSEIRDAVHPGVAWSSTPDPAAATLAEPEQGTASEEGVLIGGNSPVSPGSASAAADEPGETP